MNQRDALGMAGQILDEERIEPTVGYVVPPTSSALSATLGVLLRLDQQNAPPVQENTEILQFKSANYELLSALLGQLPDQDRLALLGFIRSRILNRGSFRHKEGPVLGAGTWSRCSSELPLVAEFLVRRGDKESFINTLNEAAPSPGLTLLLIQLERMIAYNFTLFTDEEYTRLPTAIAGVQRIIADFSKQPKPGSTIGSNTVYYVTREAPQLCDRVVEVCRKARFFYLKGALSPGVNLEVNQDKDRVRAFLENLGFPQLLIGSLEEAEKLYRAPTASPFELKSSMGHLRSFLEQLHLQACRLAHKKRGGSLPSNWGDALKCLREQDILTVKEEQFTAQLYSLMSDTSVHPLVAEREYARLMRNISIEYGLLLLTKLDKLGLM